jgi:hypothetical protein
LVAVTNEIQSIQESPSKNKDQEQWNNQIIRVIDSVKVVVVQLVLGAVAVRTRPVRRAATKPTYKTHTTTINVRNLLVDLFVITTVPCVRLEWLSMLLLLHPLVVQMWLRQEQCH